jgi:hypothetical protein
MGARARRAAAISLMVAPSLLVASFLGLGASDPAAVPQVEGRYAVTSDVGGAVWAFQPGGALVVVGPGDLVAQGSWTAGPETGEFDASMAVGVTGQDLVILGALSTDGGAIAMHVTASEATTPGAWTPWPPESRLVGERIVLGGEATPRPEPSPPVECLRPTWIEGGVVDWDRCDQEDVPSSPSPPASPATA